MCMHGQFSYFSPYDFTLVYQLATEQWEELPSCPYQNSGLVIINNKLSAVGGLAGSRPTGKLLTLRQRKWVEKYPPINTVHTDPAVVSSSDGKYLIVIWNSILQLVEGQWVEIGSMACSRNYSIYSSKSITTQDNHGGWI